MRQAECEKREQPQAADSLQEFFNRYPVFSPSRLAGWIGLNPSLMRRYKIGDANLSEQRRKRIEQRIHELGRQLMEVRL